MEAVQAKSQQSILGSVQAGQQPAASASQQHIANVGNAFLHGGQAFIAARDDSVAQEKATHAASAVIGTQTSESEVYKEALLQIELARTASNKKEFELSVDHYEKAIAKLEEYYGGQDNTEFVGYLAEFASACFSSSEHKEDAFGICKRALEMNLRLKINPNEDVIKIFSLLGQAARISGLEAVAYYEGMCELGPARTAYTKGEFDLSAVHYEKAVTKFREYYGSQESAEMAGYLVELASACFSSKSHEQKTYDFAACAIKIFQRLNIDSTEDVARAWSLAGRSVKATEDQEFDVECLSQSLQAYIRAFGENHIEVIHCLGNLGIAYGHIDANTALQCHLRSYDIYKTLGLDDPRLAAKICVHMALARMEKHEFQDALVCYKGALKYLERVEDTTESEREFRQHCIETPIQIRECLQAVDSKIARADATVKERHGLVVQGITQTVTESSDALAIIQDAIEGYKSLQRGTSLEVAGYLLEKSDLLLELNRPQEALVDADEALKIFQSVHSVEQNDGIAVASFRAGQACRELHAIEQMIAYYDTALTAIDQGDFHSQKNTETGMITILSLIARDLSKNNEHSRALRFLKSAMTRLEASGIQEEVQRATLEQQLGAAYVGLCEFDPALQHTTNAIKIMERQIASEYNKNLLEALHKVQQALLSEMGSTRKPASKGRPAARTSPVRIQTPASTAASNQAARQSGASSRGHNSPPKSEKCVVQ